MYGVRSGRGKRRTRRVQNRVRSNKNQHRLDFRGIVAHGRSDPPRALLNQWNTATISTLVVGTDSPSNVCITIANLNTYLSSQIGAVTNLEKAFRIQSAQVWHIIPNGELNNRVRCRFYSLINETTTCDIFKVLAQIDDFGTPALNASAKFIWPRTHQSNVFVYNSTEVVLRLTLEASQQVLLHVRVLYRFSGLTTESTTTVNLDGSFSIKQNTASHLFLAEQKRLTSSVLEESEDEVIDSLRQLEL